MSGILNYLLLLPPVVIYTCGFLTQIPIYLCGQLLTATAFFIISTGTNQARSYPINTGPTKDGIATVKRMNYCHLYCPLVITADYNALALFARRQYNQPVYDLATHTRGVCICRSNFQRRILKCGLHPFPGDSKLIIRKQKSHKNTQKASKRKKQKKTFKNV